MALYINPSTGSLSTSQSAGSVPFSGGSVSGGIYTNSSGQSYSSGGSSSQVGINGNIQTFADGSQLDLSTNKVIRGATNTGSNQQQAIVPNINFKPGLSSTQQSSITNLVQNKPDVSTWSTTDINNWNYATNYAPLPQIQSNTEQQSEAELGIYDSIINNDPFLTEVFQDENYKENFSKMSPEMQMAQLQLIKALGGKIEAGQVLNPNIEITPERIQEFTNQATSELDPYYQEIINNYKDDLNTSISRLKTDFETGVRNAEEPFKRNLAAVAESEAQAGLTYGSERVKREQTNVLNQQQLIDENALKVQRSAEDAYKQAERTIGSDALGNVSIPNIKDYNVNKLGFAESGLRNLYAPQGNLVGTLQKERTTNIRTRASELEDAYRQNRILNTSQLTPNVSTSVSTSNPTAPNPSAPTSYVSNYITLPSGQKISKSDPNIEDYKRYYPTLF